MAHDDDSLVTSGSLSRDLGGEWNHKRVEDPDWESDVLDEDGRWKSE